MVALLVVAIALGLNNFGAAIAIGVSGVDRRTEIKVATVFGLCDVVMPATGMLIGTGLRRPLGRRRDTVRDRGLGTDRGAARRRRCPADLARVAAAGQRRRAQPGRPRGRARARNGALPDPAGGDRVRTD